jgi:hypothetical protein
MSDQDSKATPPKAPANVSEAFTNALAELRKLLDALIPSAEDDAKKDPPPTPETPRLGEATAEAQRIRARYDGLTKWVIGVFGAIGLLIFGSVPFASLAGVPWHYLAVGLVLAGSGLIVVIWAATRSWEPVSAGLGQLARAFDTYAKKKSSRLFPTKRALWELKETIEKNPQTHLGPGMKSLDSLIERIGALERSLLAGAGTARDVASVGQGSVALVTSEVTSEIAARVLRLKDLESRESELGKKERGQLSSLRRADASYVSVKFDPGALDGATQDEAVACAIEVLQSSLPAERSPFVGREMQARLIERLDLVKAVLERLAGLPALSAADKKKLDAVVTKVVETLAELVSGLPTLEEVENDGKAKADKDRLDVYLDRRHLLLSEATVVQVGARFTVARRLLVLGGALTLAGGVVYTFGVANPNLPGPGANSIVVASVEKEAADAWTALAACTPDDRETVGGLTSVLTSSDDRDGRQDGPFSIVVIDGDCAGVSVEVGDHQGGYGAIDPAGTEASTTSEEPADSAPSLRVSVTLLATGEAWSEVAEQCNLQPSGDLTQLGAILVTPDADTTDVDRDGPFTIQVADDRCAIAPVIEVGDGEGSYVAP